MHAHRVANSRSKLPAFRYADLQPGRSKSLPVGVSLKSIGHYFEPLAIAEDGTYSQENSRRRRRRVTERITEESEISEEDLQNTWAGKARDRELVSELPSLRSRDSDVSDSGTPVPARHWHCNSGPATEQGRRADSCDSGTKLSTSPLPLAFASAQYTYDNRDILLKQRSYEGVVSERLVQQRSFGSDPTYAIEREAVTGTNANETVTTNYDPTPYIETAQRVTSTNTTDWALKQQALAFAKLDRATTTIRAVLEASSSGEKTSPNHPKTPNEHNEYERSPSPPATVVRIPRARQRQAEPPPDYFGEAYTQAQTEEGRGEGEMERDRAFYRYRTNSGHERDDSSHDEGDDDEKDALDNDETLRPMQSYTYSSPVRQESRYRGTSTTAKLEYGYDGTRSRRTSVSSIRERSPEALPSPAKTGDLFLDLAFEEMVRQRGQERERDGGGLREESAASLSRQNSRKVCSHLLSIVRFYFWWWC